MKLLILAAVFAALGGFLFGYDLGLIGGALIGIRENFGISNNLTVEAIVGAAKFGAFFGTFLGGAQMLRYGRKTAIALSSIFFSLGPIIMAVSSSSAGVIVGRLINGVGIGASAVVVPAYLGELAPAKHRGAIVQIYEMMLCIGMLCSVLVDWLLAGEGDDAWRWMVGVPAIPGAVLGLSVVVLPESPRWLVLHNRLDEALDILHRILAGGHNMAEERQREAAEDELLLLWSTVEKDKHAVVERRQQLLRKRSRGRGSMGVQYEPPPVSTVVPQAVPADDSLRGKELSGGGEEGETGATQKRGRWPFSKQTAGDSGLLLQQHGELSSAAVDVSTTGAGRGALSPRTQAAHVTPGSERTFAHTLWCMLVDVVAVAQGEEARALRIALWLAFFDQACASTALINYAPALMQAMGVDESRVAILYTSAILVTKTVGTAISLLVVDIAGRRLLLLLGSAVCTLGMLLAFAAWLAGSVSLLLLALCLFIFAFSLSWAGVFFVIISEIFSMSVKSPAGSAAVALMFLSGAVTNVVFLSLVEAAGAYTFLVFAAVIFSGLLYVWRCVPETKGRSLTEVQALIAGKPPPSVSTTAADTPPTHMALQLTGPERYTL